MFAPCSDLWASVSRDAKAVREDEETLANYASSLWKLFACTKRAYLERTQRYASDDSWLDTAEHGDWVHEGVVDRFKRAGLWRGDEVRGGNSQYNLSYRIDLLIKDGDVVVPVEIKSVNDKKFGYAVKEPEDSHMLQLQSYLHFHRPKPYPYGYLLYYNRNTDEVFVWKVEHDEEVGREIEDKLTHLEMAIANSQVPEASPSNWNCTFCPFNSVCIEADVNQEWLSRKKVKKK